jgi:hypothetical protein
MKFCHSGPGLGQAVLELRATYLRLSTFFKNQPQDLYIDGSDLRQFPRFPAWLWKTCGSHWHSQLTNVEGALTATAGSFSASALAGSSGLASAASYISLIV